MEDEGSADGPASADAMADVSALLEMRLVWESVVTAEQDVTRVRESRMGKIVPMFFFKAFTLFFTRNPRFRDLLTV